MAAITAALVKELRDKSGAGMMDCKKALAETDGDMREFLLAILAAYEDRGESELATKKLGTFLTARYGSVGEGSAKLGALGVIKNAFRTMQASLYSD